MPETDTIVQAGTNVHDWLIPVGGVLMLSLLTVALVVCRPKYVTTVRINLIWVSTLVAILTLAFGNRLIGLLLAESSNNTIEIVLGSLVGVGVGGLIAIAGQLVQDTPSPRGTECKNAPSSNPAREEATANPTPPPTSS